MEEEKLFFDYKKEPGKILKKRIAHGDSKPLVSIITSYYNSEEFIKQTLTCLQNQTFPFWEWIIVNDGSTKENTEKFLEALANMDSRIKVYKKENEGLAKGRDYAITKATTDYVLPLDADDLIVDTYVEAAYWSLRTNPEAAWAYSNSIGFGVYQYLWNVPFDSEKMKRENILTATALMRKDKILELGGYGIAKRYVNEDWHLYLRMLAKGYYPIQMNFYGFWYRRCKSSLLSHINDEKSKENELRLRDLKQEADKITKVVQAYSYPIQNDILEHKSISWEGKEFNKPFTDERILYVLPFLQTDEKIEKQIISQKEAGTDITIITLKTSPYITRQKLEDYAEVFDLTTFLNTEYWLSFIDYIIQTRDINQIYLATNEIEKEVQEYVKTFEHEIVIQECEYKNDNEVLNRQKKAYQKARRIDQRIFRKIKRMLTEKN